MAKFNRIPNADAAASVDKLAREVVRERVRAALFYWERVAKRKQSRVEDIHQLRVWSRRSLAAITLFESHLPADAATELAEILNKARKRAGKARDADILVDSLDKRARTRLKDVLEDVHDQRDAACQKLRRGYRQQVKSGRVAELLKAIGKGTAHSGENGQPRSEAEFGRWFEEQFKSAAAEFVKQLRKPRLSDRQIHPLRISGKQVRYALEIGLQTLSKSNGARLYQALEQLQEHLGAICDHQALEEQFRELAEEQKPKDRAHVLKEAAAHAQEAQAGQVRFARWWKQANGRKKLLQLWSSLAAPAPAKGPAPKRPQPQPRQPQRREPQRRKSQEK